MATPHQRASRGPSVHTDHGGGGREYQGTPNGGAQELDLSG